MEVSYARVAQRPHERDGNEPEGLPDPLERDGADLLGLSR